jgi:RNA polymerase sigma factor (sigma-70 family)
MSSPPSSTSATLLTNLRRPDGLESRVAWQRFVQVYYPLLRTYVQRLRVPATNQEDVLQEVFVRVRGSIGNYQSALGGFRAWLRGIARMTYWELRRKRGKEWPAPPDQFDRRIAPGDPQDALDRTAIVARALRVMQNEFKPITWQAFWQFVCEGMSAAEVSARLGISVETTPLTLSPIVLQ